jgi:hypothetical protein
MANPAPMHKYLTGFEKYNKDLPIYVSKPFSDDQITRLMDTIQKNKQKTPERFLLPGSQEIYYGSDRFDPKIITHMSRSMIEFICPEDIELTMDGYVKSLYKEDIRLTHYNYIDYSLRYSDGKTAPSLPPHIDADENLITFNYQIGGNVDDWQVWIDNKPYDLKNGDAIIFSAVNQVHWRPKRNWRHGEFLEIVSFDYSPTTNYRWTGQDNPIDPILFPQERENYSRGLTEYQQFKDAWLIYNRMGIEVGINREELAGITE